MSVFLASFVLFLLAALALGLGLLLGRSPIGGSCGGLNRVKGLEDACGACGSGACLRQRGGPRET